MSRERELLKRWIGDRLLNDQIYKKLKKETQELLAQPEQEVYAKGYAEAMKHQVYEAYELGRKSALSKPLSDEEIDILWGNEKAIGLYSFARVIEKHHGITGERNE